MSWWASLIPIVSLIAIIFFVIKSFGADALEGGSQFALILSAGIGITVALLYGCRWTDIEKAIADNIRCIGSGILILLLIGAIGGSWMVSGIVPTMICYGLEIIYPPIFLFAVCLICAFVSIMTGSSWTTIATIGLAMIGIGNALGYSQAWTAGAIISGAYFGDKISPLSDTTVLASSTVEVPIFEHIRYMMITTVPSFVIALAVFLTASLCHDSSLACSADGTSALLHSSFNISIWLMLVPAFSIFLIVKKVPAILTLLLSCIAACIAAIAAQPDVIAGIGDGTGSLSSAEVIFRGIMTSCFGATDIKTGSEALDTLIATRGMNGMMPTIMLIICAATFGGVLSGSGMIQCLTEKLTARISSRTGMVSSAVGTGIFCNMAMGDQYLSIILTCNLFRKLFKNKGYEDRLLSRCAEDSATVTSVLIPWNSCGMTQSTVLHIATLDYLPYCIFNLLSPLMSILIAATGYKIKKRDYGK